MNEIFGHESRSLLHTKSHVQHAKQNNVQLVCNASLVQPVLFNAY
jgi:hypothetical protein